MKSAKLALVMMIASTLAPGHAEERYQLLPGTTQKTEIRQGATIALVMDAHLANGYSWKEQIQGSAISLFRKRDLPGNGVLGHLDQQEFIFTGVSPGVSTIDLTYAQWFNPASTPQHSIIHVVVGQ